MDTFVEEYVYGNVSTRWSSSQQKEIPCQWFEEHPRQCAEDDGGFCSADSLVKYSTDISRAMTVATAPALVGRSLATHSVKGDDATEYWASFSESPFGSRQYQYVWTSAPTLALAICRAALLTV